MTADVAGPGVDRFREVADRVWVGRYPWCDVNVTLVGGAAGLLVVDTYAATGAAREVVEDVRRLSGSTGVGEVVGLVNTHWHFDHTFGNAAFREVWTGVPVHAHEQARAELAERGPRLQHDVAAQAGPDPDGRRADVVGTALVLPDHTFSSVSVVDLGDRSVELVHPGRGHTGGDLVALVPDAGVLLAGDLVEEAGPPALGEDCWPLEWPLALDVVLGLLSPGAVVVPGHGRAVDRELVEEQRAGLGVLAETIRDLAGRGVPAEQALGAAEWPWPAEGLTHAVRRGYEHLPRSQRRLPLL